MLHDFVQVSPVQEELRQRAICRQALHAQQPPPHRAINRRDLEEQLSRPERLVDQLLRLGGEIFRARAQRTTIVSPVPVEEQRSQTPAAFEFLPEVSYSTRRTAQLQMGHVRVVLLHGAYCRTLTVRPVRRGNI